MILENKNMKGNVSASGGTIIDAIFEACDHEFKLWWKDLNVFIFTPDLSLVLCGYLNVRIN